MLENMFNVREIGGHFIATLITSEWILPRRSYKFGQFSHILQKSGCVWPTTYSVWYDALLYQLYLNSFIF